MIAVDRPGDQPGKLLRCEFIEIDERCDGLAEWVAQNGYEQHLVCGDGEHLLQAVFSLTGRGESAEVSRV